jgi:uncharacterized membrane protein YphA (DoxX/SURF4 family)
VPLLPVLTVLSGVSFVLYGVSCVRGAAMVKEFERFGLARFRVLTGVLEFLGGAGLLIGLRHPPRLFLPATGLALLMLLGVGVRLKMRDGPPLTSPALLLMVVNGWIAVTAWR